MDPQIPLTQGFKEEAQSLQIPQQAGRRGLQQIYAMFLQGMSYHGIAKKLTADGIPTPGGKEK